MRNYNDSYASRMERMDEYLDGTTGLDRVARLKLYDIDDLADYAGYLGADQAKLIESTRYWLKLLMRCKNDSLNRSSRIQRSFKCLD